MRAIPPDPASTTESRGVPPRRAASPSCGLRLRKGLLAGGFALGHGRLVDRHDLDLSNDLSDVHAHLRVSVRLDRARVPEIVPVQTAACPASDLGKGKEH